MTPEQNRHTTRPIARRRTADGVSVLLWADGMVTGRLGLALPGVPLSRARTRDAQARALAVGWLMLGEVELWDAYEVPALYAAARKVAKRGGRPGDLRALMRSQRPQLKAT